jgi:hypothetical protein
LFAQTDTHGVLPLDPATISSDTQTHIGILPIKVEFTRYAMVYYLMITVF